MFKTIAVFLLGIALGVSGALGFHFSLARSPSGGLGVVNSETSSPDSTPGGAAREKSERESVAAMGTLEPRDGILIVSSALVGHRIAKVMASEGMLVNQGDLLVELDSTVDEADLKLASLQLEDARQRQQAGIETAQQRVDGARLALRQLSDSRELELATQEAKITVLAAKIKQAETDLRRLEELRKLSQPLVSDQQVEQQGVLLEVARTESKAAGIGLTQLKQALEFRQQTAEAELKVAETGLKLAQAGSGMKSLEQTIELARIKLQQTKVLAPVTGVVLSVNAHGGEIVAQAPLLRMADLDQMVCLAEVDAADLQYLDLEQEARVYSRAFRGSYRSAFVPGKAERFGSLVAKAGLQSLDPRKPVDRHVVQAAVSVEAKDVMQLVFPDDRAGPAALVGLQVEVDFPKQSGGPAVAAP